MIGGTARLGIDPTGGTDPSSHNVIWANGYLRPEWAQLSVRATATGEAITIFLEGEGVGRLGADVFFDDAGLVAVQPFCPEEKPKPPEDKEVCVDFSDLRPGTEMPPDFKKDKFAFVALDGQPQLIVALGPPVSQNSLQVHPQGLEIHLPFVADRVRVTVTGPGGAPISVSAFDTTGNLVGQANASPSGTAQTVEVNGTGITMVRVIGKEGVSVIKVCAHRAPQS
jgi:hypothetical protein